MRLVATCILKDFHPVSSTAFSTTTTKKPSLDRVWTYDFPPKTWAAHDFPPKCNEDPGVTFHIGLHGWTNGVVKAQAVCVYKA